MNLGTPFHKPAWILALTAALFLAWGPVFAPALSFKNSTIEICTAFGLVKKALEPAQNQPSKDHPGKTGHCLFCHLRQAAVLPQGPFLPVPSLQTLTVPPPAAAAQAELSAGFSYKARAPPFLPA